MTTRYRSAQAALDNVLAIARSQLGTLEGANNFTRYGTWYGLQNQPWCNIFVSWVFNQAGLLGQPFTPKSAWVPGTIEAYQSWNQAHTQPQPGDVICLEENGRAGGHVGIVESVLSSSEVVYISGNTSDPRGLGSRPAVASEQEGWGVFRRTHVIQPLDVFGRPDWAAAVATVIPAPLKPALKPTPTSTPTSATSPAPSTPEVPTAMLVTWDGRVLLWDLGDHFTVLTVPVAVHWMNDHGIPWCKPSDPGHKEVLDQLLKVRAALAQAKAAA